MFCVTECVVLCKMKCFKMIIFFFTQAYSFSLASQTVFLKSDRKLLAIPTTSAPSECIYSWAKRILSFCCDQLNKEVFEHMELIKESLRLLHKYNCWLAKNEKKNHLHDLVDLDLKPFHLCLNKRRRTLMLTMMTFSLVTYHFHTASSYNFACYDSK